MKIFNLEKTFPKISKYLANTSWIMGEKVFTILVGLSVSIIVSRYLGPEKFGLLAYSISFVSLISIAGHLGLSGLVVKELISSPSESKEIIGTSFILKFAGYLLGFILILLISYFSENDFNNTFWMVAILSMPLLIQPFEVIDYAFQANLNSKFTTIARMFGVALSSVLKIFLIVISAKVIFFALAQAMQTLIFIASLIFFYYFKFNSSVFDWRVSREKVLFLANKGSLLFLGSIFAMVYLKIDQVMIKWIVGDREVGIYAAASTISEGWYFIPTAIVASFLPKLIEKNKSSIDRYNELLQILFDILFILAFFVACIVSLFSAEIINLVYGSKFIDAAPILVIHVWSAIFVFMRAAFSRWIIIEDFLFFSVITQGFGAIINVVLNLYLIPKFGGLGAAYATLISYCVAGYFSLLLSKRTRGIFLMMSKSLLSFIRYPLNFLSSKYKGFK